MMCAQVRPVDDDDDEGGNILLMQFKNYLS